MWKDLLIMLFLKKANRSRIEHILKNEGFVYSKKDINNLLKGNQKGVRYGNIVLSRKEKGNNRKRFLKIVLDGRWKTFTLFRRQVKISEMLHKNNMLDVSPMAVIKSFLSLPLPYCIFETLEDGEDFGFMHDKPSFYQMFTEKDVEKLVNTIYKFHLSGQNIDHDTLKYAQSVNSRLGHYKTECKKLLNKKITHVPKDGPPVNKTVKDLLHFYLDISNIEQKIIEVLEEKWIYVHSSHIDRGYCLVHADMQVDNVYKHKDGSFELLDFEWVGKSDNPVIAIMYDFGNLRARAWSSPSFQKMLDEAMIKVGKKYYKDTKMIQAALTLGIVRSALTMSRYYLDFENTTKKDKRTEAEYHEMYPRTMSALISVLV